MYMPTDQVIKTTLTFVVCDNRVSQYVGYVLCKCLNIIMLMLWCYRDTYIPLDGMLFMQVDYMRQSCDQCVTG